MKQPFNTLTKEAVERLRIKPMTTSTPICYNFSQADIDMAVSHLKTLYTGNVTYTFAAKILLNNKIY